MLYKKLVPGAGCAWLTAFFTSHFASSDSATGVLVGASTVALFIAAVVLLMVALVAYTESV